MANILDSIALEARAKVKVMVALKFTSFILI